MSGKGYIFLFPGQGSAPNYEPTLVGAGTILVMEDFTDAETPKWASPGSSVADTSTTRGMGEGVGIAADRESADEDEAEPDDAEDG